MVSKLFRRQDARRPRVSGTPRLRNFIFFRRDEEGEQKDLRRRRELRRESF
ncbi:MAG: hypothetical protein HYZ69_01280 [Candidatus Colwellbacteria bacterium]|nr:hypothetical protein [Candidatus Colwellbacteria bacterium]